MRDPRRTPIERDHVELSPVDSLIVTHVDRVFIVARVVGTDHRETFTRDEWREEMVAAVVYPATIQRAIVARGTCRFPGCTTMSKGRGLCQACIHRMKTCGMDITRESPPNEYEELARRWATHEAKRETEWIERRIARLRATLNALEGRISA